MAANSKGGSASIGFLPFGQKSFFLFPSCSRSCSILSDTVNLPVNGGSDGVLTSQSAVPKPSGHLMPALTGVKSAFLAAHFLQAVTVFWSR